MRSELLLARLRAQGGNTLLLMPVAVLVVFILAAIAVDAAVLFLGQRRLSDLATSIAHDAVAAVDHDRFYDEAGGGEPVVDRDGATLRKVDLTGRTPTDDAFLDPRCGLALDGARAVVSCEARVRFVFAPAVPGAERMSRVEAVETAVGRQR